MEFVYHIKIYTVLQTGDFILVSSITERGATSQFQVFQ